MKKTANIWEYKVGFKAIIANLVCLWKCQIQIQIPDHYCSHFGMDICTWIGVWVRFRQYE